MKQWSTRMLAVTVSILAFFSIGEICFRAYVEIFKPLYRPGTISYLLWEPTPGADRVIDGVRFKVNSQGLRGPDYAVEKDKDIVRIAVIGDSITWGETSFDETYPKLLEEELEKNTNAKNVEVINFGIAGTGTKNHLSILRERVLKYEPDIVLLGYCLNDLMNDVNQSQLSPVMFAALQHSYFLSFLASRASVAARIIRAKSGIMTSDKYYSKSIGFFEAGFSRKILKDNLYEMKELTKANGAEFILLIFPFSQQFAKEASFKPQEVLAEICNKNKIVFFNTLNGLKKYDPNKLYLEDDPVHFSAFGNQINAKNIAEFLLSKSLMWAK